METMTGILVPVENPPKVVEVRIIESDLKALVGEEGGSLCSLSREEQCHYLHCFSQVEHLILMPQGVGILLDVSSSRTKW